MTVLTTKAAKLVTLVAGQTGASAAAIAMGLSGLAYGFVNPATSKGVLDWIPAHRRGTAMGLKQSGVPFGGVQENNYKS